MIFVKDQFRIYNFSYLFFNNFIIDKDNKKTNKYRNVNRIQLKNVENQIKIFNIFENDNLK